MKSVGLTDEHYHANTGLVFRSIKGTLSHIYLSETLWYNRMTGQDQGQYSKYWQDPDSYSTPTAESSIWEGIFNSRNELEENVLAQSKLWLELIEGMSEEKLLGGFNYKNSKGIEMNNLIWPILSHLTNHSTWHRGQISAAITGKGYKPLEIDLIYPQHANPNADQRSGRLPGPVALPPARGPDFIPHCP